MRRAGSGAAGDNEVKVFPHARFHVVRPDDRRTLVAISEFNAFVNPFVTLAASVAQGLGEFLACTFTFDGVFCNRRICWKRSLMHVGITGSDNTVDGDWPPLNLVGLQQLASAPALQHRGELPADIHRIADA